MTPNSRIGLGILVVILIIGGIFLLNRRSNPIAPTATSSPVNQFDNRTPSTTEVSPSPMVSASPTLTPTSTSSSRSVSSNVRTISYTGSAFSPSTLTISAGQSVVFVNNGSGDVNVESNPHPLHTDYPPLNLGVISPGQTSTAVAFPTKGTFGYHNHLDPTQMGTIVVQ